MFYRLHMWTQLKPAYIVWEVCTSVCVTSVCHLCALPLSPRAAVTHDEPQCRLRPDSASGRRSRLWELRQRARAQQERADGAGNVLNYPNDLHPYWALGVQDSAAGRLPLSWSWGTGLAPAESEERRGAARYDVWKLTFYCCLYKYTKKRMLPFFPPHPKIVQNRWYRTINFSINTT